MGDDIYLTCERRLCVYKMVRFPLGSTRLYVFGSSMTDKALKEIKEIKEIKARMEERNDI